jgi:hydroxymethylglutaryl-CoA lyase
LSAPLAKSVLPASVGLVEVGPRDGLQNEPTLVGTAGKIEFIGRAVAAGLRRIEVASFVSPKRVPQMADADELLSALPRPAGVSYIGLVLNQRGFERARAARCDEIGMAVVASDTFSQRNQGTTIAESLADWHAIAAEALAAGIRPHVTIAAVCGCPFEGEVPIARVVEIAQRAAEARPAEIALADTIGAGVPGQVAEIFGRVREALPGMPLRGHFHNTRNTGLANAYAALQEGATTLDASIGGIGGCPFAPAATGNIPTEDLLYMLERMGIATGVDLEQLLATSRWLQETLGRPVPGMVVKAGGFPKARTPGTAH